jgi:transcriptional regulator with XRE-family HTH domain
MSQVGEEIRRRREERGWTGAELAVRAGMAPSAVSQIETGRRHPNSGSLIKLASALDVEVADLFPKGGRRSSLEPSFNDVLEGERRRAEIEEVRRYYRSCREELDEFCEHWEGRLAADDLDRRSLEEFFVTTKHWLPILQEVIVSEQAKLLKIFGGDQGLELRRKVYELSEMWPAAERYIELGQRLAEAGNKRFPSERLEPPTLQVIQGSRSA